MSECECYPIRYGPQTTRVLDVGRPVFRPEYYGTPTGTDSSIDMPLVQAAIDDAGAVGGIVRLDNTYAVGEQGFIQCGNYANAYYGLWCNYDDVLIDGHGTGTIVLEAAGAHASYAMLLIGCGGYMAGAFPGLAWLLANGDIPHGVKVRDLAFDASVLNAADMAFYCTSPFSAALMFAFCQEFEVDGVTVDQGFGNNGGIGCIATCRDFVVRDCTVDTAYEMGFFADGAKDCEFDNCVVNGEVDPAVISTGMSICTSGDYRSYSENVNIHDCIVTGTWDGIATSGEGARVTDCTITLKDQNLTRIGITAGVGYSVAADCDSDGSATVTGNIVQRPVGATWKKGYGIYLNGRAVGFGGGPLHVHDCEIHGNTVSRMTYGLVLGVEADDNTFTFNTIEDCTAISADVSGGTANGNTISDNTVI